MQDHVGVHVDVLDGTGPGGQEQCEVVPLCTVQAFTAGGSLSARVWPSTALALADGQTKALSLACRVAQDPAELRYAVAELLMAEPVLAPSATVRSFVEGSEVLKIPSPAGEPLVFSRVGDPFTAAESARAHRLSELAAVATHPTNRTF